MQLLAPQFEGRLRDVTTYESANDLINGFELLIAINYQDIVSDIETIFSSSFAQSDVELVEQVRLYLDAAYINYLERLGVEIDEQTPFSAKLALCRALNWIESYEDHQSVVDIIEADDDTTLQLVRIVSLSPFIKDQDALSYITDVQWSLIRNVKILHQDALRYELDPVEDISERKEMVISQMRKLKEIRDIENNLVVNALAVGIPLNLKFSSYLGFLKARILAAELEYDEKITTLLLLTLISCDGHKDPVKTLEPLQEEFFSTIEEMLNSSQDIQSLFSKIS